METLTVFIGISLSVLVLLTPARLALVFYTAGLVWYPIYVTAKLGTLNFSVPRIVILAIFFKILTDGNLRSAFRWILLDYLIIFFSLACFVVNLFTAPFEQMIQFNSGAQFDTAMVYFMVRLLITSKHRYLTLLKGLLVIAIPMAVMGIYQCLFFVNPLGFFKKYHAWSVIEDTIQVREHFCRADLAFSHPIMFGMFFAIVGAWCMGLWPYVDRRWRFMFALCMILMVLGLSSSMSSGPQLAGFGVVVALVIFRYRKYWKLFLGVFVGMMIFIEIISNRHWYYVASSYLSFNAETAYGRCKLIEHALGGGMSGHWLLGFGFKDPGWWATLQGSELKGTDITNHYIVVLVQWGLVGLVPFLAVVYEACRNLRKAFVSAVTDADRWLIWCIISAMVGVLLAMFSVSLMGQIMNLFYVMLGFCGAMSEIARRRVPHVCADGYGLKKIKVDFSLHGVR